MKTARRRNMTKTAAFVSALLIAFSGMTGVMAVTGMNQMMTVSASETTANTTITVEGTEFGLNAGDTAEIQNISNSPEIQTLGIVTSGTSLEVEAVPSKIWAVCTKRKGNASGVTSEISYYVLYSVNGSLYWRTGLKAEYEAAIQNAAEQNEKEAARCVTVSGKLFGLNSGDSAVMYLKHRTEYGNTAVTELKSITADTNETIDIGSDASDGVYVKRYKRTGTADGVKTDVDYFHLVRTENYSQWVYTSAEVFDLQTEASETTGSWATIADSVIIPATKADFNLSDYNLPDNMVKQDNVVIYSTALDAAGASTCVGTLSGNDASDLLLNVNKAKNTGYIAVRTQGGVQGSNSKNLETVSMYRYDMDKEQWVLFYDSLADKTESRSFNTLTLFPKEATFPMLVGKDVQELRVYRTVDGERTLMKTFDKETFYGGWGAMDTKFDNGSMGFCYAPDYTQYSWEADVYEEFTSDYVKVHDAKCISGKFLANIPYATGVTETSSERTVLTDFIENLSPTTNSAGATVLPAVVKLVSDEAQTRPVYMNDEFSELEKGEHGNVYLYQDTELVAGYTAGEFDNGCFSIPEYTDKSEYFLKVAHSEGEETASDKYYTIYKWDEEAGKWKFRVNSEQTPVASVAITNTELTPILTGDFTATLNLVTGTGETEKKTAISSWTKAEFNAGNITAPLSLQSEGYYEVVFSASESSEEGIYGTISYRYMGIDPVLYKADMNLTSVCKKFYNSAKSAEENAKTGLKEVTTASPVTNAKTDDVIVVDGTAADGSKVHYTTNANVDNVSVKLPEGSFTITNETAGFKANVEVKKNDDGTLYAVVTDSSSVDSRFVNISSPVEGNQYVITALDGTVLETGKMSGAALKNKDLTIKPADIQKKTYVTFSSENGIVNSTAEDAVITEDGCLAVVDGKITKVLQSDVTKGDMTGDGKLSVSDIVMLQKYLHGKGGCTVNIFLNADFNGDGKVNVFDLALLKKELLNQ